MKAWLDSCFFSFLFFLSQRQFFVQCFCVCQLLRQKGLPVKPDPFKVQVLQKQEPNQAAGNRCCISEQAAVVSDFHENMTGVMRLCPEVKGEGKEGKEGKEKGKKRKGSAAFLPQQPLDPP